MLSVCIYYSTHNVCTSTNDMKSFTIKIEVKDTKTQRIVLERGEFNTVEELEEFVKKWTDAIKGVIR